ncbi:hypothetical protein [Barnesiella intestinihominis]|uniref:hypothetical protein n=1 Tax=Barnesiella intestinihominis TaxID=487174 RepID=UPI003F7BB518
MRRKRNFVVSRLFGLIGLFLMIGNSFGIYGQGDFEKFRQGQKAQMEQFKKNKQAELKNYRDSLNAEYAGFLEKTWESFNLFREERGFKPMPEPPVYVPEESTAPKPDIPVPMAKLNPLPPGRPSPVKDDSRLPDPDPVPIETEQANTVCFFGTSVRVKATASQDTRLSGVSEQAVADYWKSLSQMPFSVWGEDTRRLRRELSLDDWGTFQLMNKLFEAYVPEGTRNERVVFSVFMMNQLGYRAKIGRAGDKLYALLASHNNLSNTSYFTFGGRGETVKYFVINPSHENLSAIQSCSAEYGTGGKAIDFSVTALPRLSDDENIQTLRFLNDEYSIEYNRNLVDYYATYPCVDFSVYANAPLDNRTLKSLKRVLLPPIAHVSQKEAVDFLLHFVQNAFLYKTDQDQYGYEKWNFAEETLVSSYSDCDDRAVLFAQLVKNLLEMEVVLIYYPGVHLATAVYFDTDQVSGSYVVLDNRKFMICDPTYINADSGMSMPDLQNIPVEIIRL